MTATFRKKVRDPEISVETRGLRYRERAYEAAEVADEAAVEDPAAADDEADWPTHEVDDPPWTVTWSA